MGSMGHGYGSECHLLRYLGRHRHEFDRRVLEVVGGESVDWLDFQFDPAKRIYQDAEWKGLDFVDADRIQHEWAAFWPQARGIQNWDAVGRLRRAGIDEWLLVEAKSHPAELRSDCGAVSERSKAMILKALGETQEALGVSPTRPWHLVYYQFCNRLATLYFLHSRHVPARLLFIYFTGDMPGPRRLCPQDAQGWRDALDGQTREVGLPTGHPLEDRIHKLFLPVAGAHASAAAV